MQLFTVGTVKLNPDGSEVLVGGNPVPTYDNEDWEKQSIPSRAPK